MFHLFSDTPADAGMLSVRGEQYNHMKNVLRMREGEELEVSFAGEGTRLFRIREIGEEEILLAPAAQEASASRELPVRVTLCQGLPKADKMEVIIQKAVELGAYRVRPVEMKRCVARIEEKKADRKRERWQKIAEAAAMQSRRDIVPEVEAPVPLREALRLSADADHILVAYEEETGYGTTGEILRGIRPGESVCVFIGPEGGIDESEMAVLREAGARPISLGRRILRTETAGMSVLSWFSWIFEIGAGTDGT